ncbi:MAG: hypothetical protein QM778_21615 [Myxococcales bacterium]
MPVIAAKKPKPTQFQVRFGPSVGKADDFWVLAYCPEQDELEREENPDHTQFTYVLRYRLPERTLVGRYPARLDGLWQRSDGTLWAVGDTLGYVEISAAGMTEIALDPVPGQFSSIWGLDDDHVFTCGIEEPFAYYYLNGKWNQLPLPEGTENVSDVRAFGPDDAYFVGDEGQIHHFDGRTVSRVKAPVRRHLTAIVRLDDKRLCIGGYQGTLMVGSLGAWRHQVTNTTDPLLALAALDGHAYYGADEKVWVTDGVQPPTVAIDFAARWVSGLVDGLVLSHEEEAKLYAAGMLTDLDLSI